MVRYCSVCGSATLELEDVCDAIVRGAIRRDIELMYVKEDPEFDHVGGIAALFRFRADGKNKKAAVASRSYTSGGGFARILTDQIIKR